MARSQLRIYNGPKEDSCVTLSEAANGQRVVTMPVAEILPLLAEAVSSQRTWLADFGDDDITISTDLYEVLLAYQHFRRPTA